MAKRRMFSKDIVRSDAFLDLPVSSQALYFHLGMEADDRGYVCSPKTVIRSLGATLGDLEQLANKKFILIRGEGLVLIKGWRINNTIQPTRLVETMFTDDLKKLFFDENNSYTEKPTDNPVLCVCQQNVDNLSTQGSIGKLSIDKYSKEGYTKINNDEPLFCESCYRKLTSKKFLSLEDFADKDGYLELFNLLLEKYTKKNIVISLNYTLFQVCARKWNPEKQCQEYEGIRTDYAIDDKYSYLRTSLYTSCEKFKNGYESFIDRNSAYFDRELLLADLQYECEDAKIKEFTE